jgi:hypothetical protein
MVQLGKAWRFCGKVDPETHAPKITSICTVTLMPKRADVLLYRLFQHYKVIRFIAVCRGCSATYYDAELPYLVYHV